MLSANATTASEVGAAVASARLRLHGFYGGCKGTTLFRPLVAVVGSVLPSGAGVSGDATVGDHLLRVTGQFSGLREQRPAGGVHRWCLRSG